MYIYLEGLRWDRKQPLVEGIKVGIERSPLKLSTQMGPSLAEAHTIEGPQACLTC